MQTGAYCPRARALTGRESALASSPSVSALARSVRTCGSSRSARAGFSSTMLWHLHGTVPVMHASNGENSSHCMQRRRHDQGE